MKGLLTVIVVVVVLLLVWAVVRRVGARRDEQNRAEAARLREQARTEQEALRDRESDAAATAATAEAAQEVARAQAARAEELAAEAARAEDEVAAERARHEEHLRRADEIDPDVDGDARRVEEEPQPVRDHEEHEDHGEHEDHEDHGEHEEPGDAAEPAPRRRVSHDLSLVRDGGHGVGSAAPLEDGAQPLGHPVKARRDTMTYVEPDGPGYDDTDPDVWFTDAGAAEHNGYRSA